MNHPTAFFQNENSQAILARRREEIIVTVEADRLRIVLQWQGGRPYRGLKCEEPPLGKSLGRTDIEDRAIVTAKIVA